MRPVFARTALIIVLAPCPVSTHCYFRARHQDNAGQPGVNHSPVPTPRSLSVSIIICTYKAYTLLSFPLILHSWKTELSSFVTQGLFPKFTAGLNKVSRPICFAISNDRLYMGRGRAKETWPILPNLWFWLKFSSGTHNASRLLARYSWCTLIAIWYKVSRGFQETVSRWKYSGAINFENMELNAVVCARVSVTLLWIQEIISCPQISWSRLSSRGGRDKGRNYHWDTFGSYHSR